MKNAQSIYNQLLASGVTKAGALGLMGNWMAESGLEANRLQGDFNEGRTLSRAYTADVMSGRISRSQFARDSKGYGLAQWTYYTRKEDLYDFWKGSGKALDDVSLQVTFALQELSTQGEYSGLWSVLKTTDDIWTATDKVCRLYERPYYNNVDARYRYAKELEAELVNLPKEPNVVAGALEQAPGTVPCCASPARGEIAGLSPVPSAETFWPPRMIDRNMSGSDVAVLQALLAARGLYGNSIDGYFGEELDKSVRQFQREYGLDADGVVGPLTWGKLLQR